MNAALRIDTMSKQLSPAIQAVFDRMAATTRNYHIRYYPALSEITGSPVFSIVLSRLLYHEDLRLKRNAAFFAATDHQLASECGLGEYQFAAARDLICAPGIALFTRVRRGQPPINHYAGDLARIHAWLTANGFGHPPPSSGKNPDLNQGKTGNQKPEKPASSKELVKIFIDDDDAARARALDHFLNAKGIENPTRLQIVTLWYAQIDALDVADRIIYATECEFQALSKGQGNRKVKSVNGLVVSRLRGEYEERTGRSATDILPDDLDTIRAVLASAEVAR